MDERSRHRQFEDQFLRQITTRAQALVRRGLPADQVQVESVGDGVDTVRAVLQRLGEDRDLLEQLPGTRAVQMRFQRRVFGPFHTTVAKLRAQTLAPLEELVAATAGGPVGREQVLDALARYDLLPHRERPTAVVLASATGFTPEARALVHRGESPALILMGGRADGGWEVELSSTLRRGPWAKLFDLESQDERLRRLLAHLDKQAVALESRGVALTELAQQAGLPLDETERLVRQACRTDTRLMTVVHDGAIRLCRSPLPEESQTMNLRSWIRKLFRLKPTISERVRHMTEQRVKLEQQRHEVDQRVTGLEQEERELVEKGATARTDAERKQLAGRLVRTRRDLRRVRAQADIFTQQIDVLGTHIHHLTLGEQGKRFELPSAEELTQEAAQAEGMMADLAARADLAHSIEVGAQTPLMEEEEAAILAEFKQAAAERAPAAESAAGPAAEPPARSGERASAREVPPVPSPGEKGKARPELS